jgi:hypothetical protein
MILIVWALLSLFCYGGEVKTVVLTEPSVVNKTIGGGQVRIAVGSGEVVSVVKELEDSLLVKWKDLSFSVLKENTSWESQLRATSRVDDSNGWKAVTSPEFESAIKTGTARWEARKDGFWVYSWSYGEPGVVWLGNLGTNQSIEATMSAERYEPHGYFGIAVGISDPDKSNGHLKNKVFLVRIRGGKVELVKYIPLVWETIGVADGVSLKTGEEVVLSLCVTKAKTITVYLNGKEIFSYEASSPVHGHVGVVAANGVFMFKQVRTGHGSSIGK